MLNKIIALLSLLQCLFNVAGSQNLFEGNLTLIMGLVWTLIQHYQMLTRGQFISLFPVHKYHYF